MIKSSLLRSSTFRLALLYMALSGGSVIFLLGFIYWATAGYADRQTDATIEAEIRGLAEQYQRRGLAGLTSVIAERVAQDPGGASVYLLSGNDLTPLVGNLDRWPDAPAAQDGWVRFRLRDWGQDKSEAHEARARIFRLRGSLHLLVGRDVRDLEATRELIINALVWGLVITAALALGGGAMMSAGVRRRIEAINQTSREIMEGDLSRRVPSDGSADDFDQLAANLNRMLARIEHLMESVRQVSDNIAHDLRTPLTRLRTKLELVRSSADRPEKIQEAVDQAVEDAEELLATFNALLRIARIEATGSRSHFRALDLARLLRDVAEFYEPLASDKQQHLAVQVADELSLEGDRDLLFQALANLVDNAVKYTPEGGSILLSGYSDSAGSEITIADSGPGIPAELRDKVLQRFFRLDSSRSTPGSGLGLSLVQAVARLHGAAISLADNAPGLRVRIRFAALEKSAHRPYSADL